MRLLLHWEIARAETPPPQAARRRKRPRSNSGPRHHDKPNDQADNVRNALVVIEAVEEERASGRAQL
jgi:hypothetical protein